MYQCLHNVSLAPPVSPPQSFARFIDNETKRLNNCFKNRPKKKGPEPAMRSSQNHNHRRNAGQGSRAESFNNPSRRPPLEAMAALVSESPPYSIKTWGPHKRRQNCLWKGMRQEPCRFICQECCIDFQFLTQFENHVDKNHHGKLKFLCTYQDCSDLGCCFDCRSSFWRHQRKHHYNNLCYLALAIVPKNQ